MVINYPYIPEGRTILYVSEDDFFMKESIKTARQLSTDKLQSTGAVIVKDGQIVGRGANQVLIKSPKLQSFHQKRFCPRKLLKVKSGTKYWLCPSCSTNKDHAESQAVLDAQKNGQDTSGADLYLWGHWWCCKPCWDTMIEAGIKNVYLMEESEKLFNTGNLGNVLGKQFN
jgi:deoxycytidylate deaminase